jgi:hypothetical protein
MGTVICKFDQPACPRKTYERTYSGRRRTLDQTGHALASKANGRDVSQWTVLCAPEIILIVGAPHMSEFVFSTVPGDDWIFDVDKSIIFVEN